MSIQDYQGFHVLCMWLCVSKSLFFPRKAPILSNFSVFLKNIICIICMISAVLVMSHFHFLIFKLHIYFKPSLLNLYYFYDFKYVAH